VRYLLIGGIAAQVWGSPSLTGDLDLCYERSPENLERLAAALKELKARLRGPGIPADLPFKLDAKTLGLGDHFTFATDAGDLDCLGTPSGTTGYGELVVEAPEIELHGIRIRVVSLEDLMRMKRAAGRAKDRAELEVLGALRDELERRGGRGLAEPAPTPDRTIKRRVRPHRRTG
jgi:hypothetical protein